MQNLGQISVQINKDDTVTGKYVVDRPPNQGGRLPDTGLAQDPSVREALTVNDRVTRYLFTVYVLCLCS